MAHHKHLPISEMYYLLLDGFAELLNDNFRPPSIKLDQADEQSSLELNLLI